MFEKSGPGIVVLAAKSVAKGGSHYRRYSKLESVSTEYSGMIEKGTVLDSIGIEIVQKKGRKVSEKCFPESRYDVFINGNT